jgi:hypothetical protein
VVGAAHDDARRARIAESPRRRGQLGHRHLLHLADVAKFGIAHLREAHTALQCGHET